MPKIMLFKEESGKYKVIVKPYPREGRGARQETEVSHDRLPAIVNRLVRDARGEPAQESAGA